MLICVLYDALWDWSDTYTGQMLVRWYLPLHRKLGGSHISRFTCNKGAPYYLPWCTFKLKAAIVELLTSASQSLGQTISHNYTSAVRLWGRLQVHIHQLSDCGAGYRSTYFSCQIEGRLQVHILQLSDCGAGYRPTYFTCQIVGSATGRHTSDVRLWGLLQVHIFQLSDCVAGHHSRQVGNCLHLVIL